MDQTVEIMLVTETMAEETATVGTTDEETTEKERGERMTGMIGKSHQRETETAIKVGKETSGPPTERIPERKDLATVVPMLLTLKGPEARGQVGCF